jgi:exodeoxyribonuclease-5
MADHLDVSDLSSDQREVYEAIVGWAQEGADNTPVLSVGGYAGTGKTTVVSLVAENLPPPIAFCAYTGKASSVLKRKLAAAGMFTVGVQKADRDGRRSLETRPYCGTIHSLIYRPCECREPKAVDIAKPCPTCKNEVTQVPAGFGAAVEPEFTCPNGHTVTAKVYEGLKAKTILIRAEKDESGNCRICHGKEWLRREILDRDYSLIIVDEASMVDDTMLRDLKSFMVPILAVGDHGQLPPVGGVGSLMRDPMLRLERIHRQAEGNPIIALSKMVREQGIIPDSLPGDAVRFGRLRFVEQALEERYADASPARLLEMGLICYTNRRRVGLNTMVRRIRGYARQGNELPRQGEHVVCLRNMKPKGQEPVYNGMRGVLLTDADPKQNVNYEGKKLGESETHLIGSIEFPDDGIGGREYEMLRRQFLREKTFAQAEELQRETGISSFAMAGALFDFGWAMTCHKMQGSQCDDLVVLVERPGPVSDEDWRKWLYTAVTRAANKLTVLR